MSLLEVVALTHLVSAVIVLGVIPMLLSDHPPAWLAQDDPYDAVVIPMLLSDHPPASLVQDDPYVEDRWQNWRISNEHRGVRSLRNACD